MALKTGDRVYAPGEFFGQDPDAIVKCELVYMKHESVTKTDMVAVKRAMVGNKDFPKIVCAGDLFYNVAKLKK